MYDVVALGELLIDFTQNGISEQGNPVFEANPGGAPCNVLSMLQQLGKKTAFIGKVGQDQFGQMLKSTIEKIGIDTINLILDEHTNTTLAFVHTAQDGDRDFSFYRKPGADMMLTKEEVSEAVIKDGKIFHFGTLSMTSQSVRNATKYAIQIAKEKGLLISFDPNLRPPLWESMALAKEQIEYGLSQCDIVKMSEEELEFVTRESDISKGVEKIRNEYNIKLVVITMGKKGSMAFYRDCVVKKEAFLLQNTIETTGAGDTFFGCILNSILELGIDYLDESLLGEMLIFANAAAALITTKRGALCVMPRKEEILKLIHPIIS